MAVGAGNNYTNWAWLADQGIIATVILLFIFILILWWLTRKPSEPEKPVGEPNMSTIVSLRANFELATQYLYAWTNLVVNEGLRLGYDITDLHTENATKPKYLKALEEKSPIFFFGCGHGNTDVFAGQDNEEIMTACVNDELMSGRIVYLISCSCGYNLGPSMVTKTALTFMGYTQDFIFAIQEGFEENPLEDPYAQGYFEAANAPALLLLQGKSLKEVYESTMDVWNYWINYWGQSDDPNAPTIRTYLIHNRDAFIIIGEGGLYPPPTMRLSNLPILIAPVGFLALLSMPKL